MLTRVFFIVGQDIREGQLQAPVVVRQTGPRLKTLSQGGTVSLVPPSPSRSVSGQRHSMLAHALCARQGHIVSHSVHMHVR